MARSIRHPCRMFLTPPISGRHDARVRAARTAPARVQAAIRRRKDQPEQVLSPCGGASRHAVERNLPVGDGAFGREHHTAILASPSGKTPPGSSKARRRFRGISPAGPPGNGQPGGNFANVRAVTGLPVRLVGHGRISAVTPWPLGRGLAVRSPAVGAEPGWVPIGVSLQSVPTLMRS